MRSIAIALGIASFVSACGTAQPPRDSASPLLTAASTNVGKNFWVSPAAPLGLQLCEEPMGALDTKCEPVKKGKFSVQGVESEKIRGGAGIYQLAGLMYRVAFDGGRSGYIRELDLDAYAVSIDPAIAAAECKRRGNPRIGMTANQAITTCWGKPERVNRTETGATTSDQYVYSNDRYLYFRDGVLTSMQTTGQLAR